MFNEPLATRLRPRLLNEIVGQDHLLGEGKILTRMVSSKKLTSVIFHGPPGVGKTSIASALAKDLGMDFKYFNASTQSKEDLKKLVETSTLMFPSVILIDEIHRLNKLNQDYLLMKVESGVVTLVGATTENPYMSINPALRSRSRILELKKVSSEAILQKLKFAIESKRGYGDLNIEISEGFLEKISQFSNGDLRSALNTLEIAVESTGENEDGTVVLDNSVLKECIQSQTIDGDSNGDAHYNLLSAFQKSIRGSDVDASLHYLARLIKIGDLVSINRRLLVTAYEDIGLANPEVVAETLSAITSTERVGFPEAQIILGYIVTRLALSPKSNTSYKAIKKALEALNTNRSSDIPISLHDTHYNSAKSSGKGAGYEYSHNFKHGLSKQQFIPDDFVNDRYLEFRDEENLPQIQAVYNRINSIIK